MATNTLPLCNHFEDEYIDMELSSSSSTTALSFTSQTREFEFQMCDSINLEKETIISPADELFYKGNLLPLHLPPRLQMVQNLFQNSATNTFKEYDQECSIVLPYNTIPLDQPFDISPSESCRVSCEFSPDDYFEWSSELSGFINGTDQPKKSWSKNKLKLIKKSSLGQKLRASRAYLKSLFSKSGGSDESCAKASSNAKESGHISKGSKNYISSYIDAAKKTPSAEIGKEMKFPTLSTVINGIEKEGFDQDNVIRIQRKSLSGTIKRQSTMKSSSSSSISSGSSSLSSSFSFNSDGVHDLQLLFPAKMSISTCFFQLPCNLQAFDHNYNVCFSPADKSVTVVFWLSVFEFG